MKRGRTLSLERRRKNASTGDTVIVAVEKGGIRMIEIVKTRRVESTVRAITMMSIEVRRSTKSIRRRNIAPSTAPAAAVDRAASTRRRDKNSTRRSQAVTS